MTPHDKIVQLLAAHPEGLQLVEICQMVGLGRTSASNVLGTLHQRGRIECADPSRMKRWTIAGTKRDINRHAPEYLKVSSIWRVAQRYASQVSA